MKRKICLCILALILTLSCVPISAEPVNNETELFTESSITSFWYGDNQYITNHWRIPLKSEPEHSAFDKYSVLEMHDEDEFYSSNMTLLYYFNEIVDITDIIETGTLRFYAKANKLTEFRLELTAEDYSRTGKDIIIQPSDTWTEIKIPLKEMSNNAGCSIKKIKWIYITPKNKDTFLSKGEKLSISSFQLWTKDSLPLEFVAADTTPIYNSEYNEGVFLRDINRIMPIYTKLTVYNIADRKSVLTALRRSYSNVNIIDCRAIYVLNDNNKGYTNIAQLPGEVEIHVPITEDMSNADFSAAVISDKGRVTEIPVEKRGGYAVLKTTAAGDIAFFTHGGLNAILSGTISSENYKGILILSAAFIIFIYAVIKTGKKSHAKKALSACIAILIITGICAGCTVADINDEDEYLLLALLDDHPGIPGQDANYRFKFYRCKDSSMKVVNSNDVTITADIPDIKIEKDTLTIPAEFRESTDMEGFKIRAYLKADNTVTGIYPMKIVKWDMTFNDEFDSEKIDTKKWMLANEGYEMTLDVGLGKTAHNHPDSFKPENGNLVARILPSNGEPMLLYDGSYLVTDYWTSQVTTEGKFTQRFGCFVTNVKIPEEGASNTAFWLMPTNGGWGNTFFYNRLSDGAGCGEIDIIETSPDWKGGYCITEHYWDPTSGGKLASSYSELRSESLTNNEYAQLAVVWTENTLYYYCDGELVRTYRNLEATENDAFILLSLGCGSFDRNQNSWVGWLTEEQVEKQVSYFDYVRVYKAG